MTPRRGSRLSTLVLLAVLPASAAAQPSPSALEGMWSDPPATAEGMFCFFACTDTGIARLNALLDETDRRTRGATICCDVGTPAHEIVR